MCETWAGKHGCLKELQQIVLLHFKNQSLYTTKKGFCLDIRQTDW